MIDSEERRKKRSISGEIFANPNCVYYLELSKCEEMNGIRQIRANIENVVRDIIILVW